MVKEISQEEKEWKIRGYSDEITKKFDSKLMEDRFSYWFRYRSIPWYRKRRIRGTIPKKLIEEALKELHLEGNVWREKITNNVSWFWIIELNSEAFHD